MHRRWRDVPARASPPSDDPDASPLQALDEEPHG
jgi:hypothetical protein